VIGGRGTSVHRGEPLLLRGAVQCPFHPAVDGFVRASLLSLARNLCGLSPLVQRDAVWIQLSGIQLVAESRHDAKLFLVHCELVPTVGGRVTRLEDLVGLVLVTRLARFITVLIQQEAPKWDSFVHPMAVRISETCTPMLLPRHQGVLLATRFRRTGNGGIHLKRPVGFLHLGLVPRHRLPLHDEELVAWNDELRDDRPTFSVTDRQLVSIAQDKTAFPLERATVHNALVARLVAEAHADCPADAGRDHEEQSLLVHVILEMGGGTLRCAPRLSVLHLCV